MVDINNWDSVWKGKGTSAKPYQLKSRLEEVLLNGTIDKVIKTLDVISLSLKKEIITIEVNIILNSQKYLIEK